jgi:hypothetical protein
MSSTNSDLEILYKELQQFKEEIRGIENLTIKISERITTATRQYNLEIRDALDDLRKLKRTIKIEP